MAVFFLDFDRYSVSSCDHSFDEFENEINPSSSSSVDEDELPSEVGASNSENASAASDQLDSILPCDVSCMFSDKEEDFSNLVPGTKCLLWLVVHVLMLPPLPVLHLPLCIFFYCCCCC